MKTMMWARFSDGIFESIDRMMPDGIKWASSQAGHSVFVYLEASPELTHAATLCLEVLGFNEIEIIAGSAE